MVSVTALTCTYSTVNNCRKATYASQNSTGSTLMRCRECTQPPRSAPKLHWCSRSEHSYRRPIERSKGNIAFYPVASNAWSRDAPGTGRPVSIALSHISGAIVCEICKHCNDAPSGAIEPERTDCTGHLASDPFLLTPSTRCLRGEPK